MKNAKVMVAKVGRGWKAVVVGESSERQTGNRASLVLPGQPRKGWAKDKASAHALEHGPAALRKATATKWGSYLPEWKWERMQAELAERPAPSAASRFVLREVRRRARAPNVEHVAYVTVEEIGDLILHRRAALKALAAIDAKLALAGGQWSTAIHLGMDRPLPNGNEAHHA